ncbi:hypothetical protein [Xanthomonas campestris]|uniref:hypothetical protein n=1 Tax=Xanthomonas campestris TaxID=339 RepID=UPI000E32D1AD|nr:hypothetical protein [Xanthomonas campestris]RFF50153.1 hypothetical protein D0A35_10790 [Xanthomonas campestris]
MEAITLFAQIDQSAVSPNGKRESDEWVFDAFVATEMVQGGLVPSEDMAEEAIDVHYPVILIAVDGKALRSRFGLRLLISGTAWYQITLGKQRGIPARVIGVPGDERVEVSIAEIRRVDRSQARKLDALVDMPHGEEADLTILSSLFGEIGRLDQAPDVVVVDVGQGSLAAVCKRGGSDQPLLFVDLGWPTNFNRAGQPNYRPDVTGLRTPVLLTHWDWDHWGLALNSIKWAGSPKRCVIKWNVAALERPWVVPGVGKHWGGVKLSPMHWRFALALARKGKLYRWPLSQVMISNNWFMVTRVSGGKPGNRNNHGLVVVVVDKINSSGECRAILLPGDADYSHLPFSKPGWKPVYSFSGLAASHHGGKVVVGKIPAAASPAWLAISVGIGNRYKHPAKQAQRGYIEKGWTWQAPTSHRSREMAQECAHGNILLTTASIRIQWPAGGPFCFWRPVQ